MYTIAPPRVDSSKGPPRKIRIFFDFSGPRKKWPGMAPNGAGNVFFRLIQTLPTFWAERILIFIFFIFGIFLDPKFPDFQVPRFPDFRKIGPYSSGDHFSESCAPRKMMQNGIDEIFWGQTFKNTPYFNLRPPYFWKPLTCGYVAAGAFFSRKKGPIFLEAPNSVSYTHLTLPTILRV